MKVKVGEEEVFLDPKNLIVDEVNLNDFLKRFAPNYSHFNMMWAKSQFIQRTTEDRHDVVLADRYRYYKENDGGSDKLAESKAKVHEDVIEAKKRMQNARFVTQILNGYLRSLDKAQESALNLGYNIRKEMDKLFPQSIRGPEMDPDAQMAQMLKDEGEAK